MAATNCSGVAVVVCLRCIVAMCAPSWREVTFREMYPETFQRRNDYGPWALAALLAL
jgi:hypothetical protein